MQQVSVCACVVFVTFCSQTSSSIALSRCQDTSIRQCTCSYDREKGTVTADCSDTGLKSVPENLPPNITHLYLDSNNIATLQNGLFGRRHLPNLIFLSIRHNQLKEISTAAFQGLDKLNKLNLYNNSLKYKKSLPGSVFHPLSQSLKVLDIRMNLLGAEVHYPSSVGELHSLEELRVDCLRGQSLPSRYSNLKQLRKITFSRARKHVGLLNDNLFSAVRDLNVTEVDLAGLDIGVIGKQTFSRLPNLKKLDLSNNIMLGLRYQNFASSLKNTSIQSLMLNNTGMGPTGSSVKLQAFCGLNLKTLTLDSNEIEILEPVFTKCFPELEILSLADNHIVPPLSLCIDIMKLRNLAGFNASSQYRVRHKRDISATKSSSKIFTTEIICGDGMACPLFLPPKIKWIDVSHNGVRKLRTPELALIRNSTLRYFNISFCGMQTIQLPIYCLHSTITTVVPQVETIDISNNNLQCLNASVFDISISHCDWSSLKYFYLRNNKLGQVAGNICNRDRNNTLGFLKPLTNLRILDLAGNILESENQRLSDLKVLTRLEKLDLSSNGFHDFSLDLSNMTNLQKLDLSNNNIQCLSKSTIRQLNQIKKSNPIQIDLSVNTLSCTCQCLHFYLWLPMSGIDFLSLGTYECTFQSGEKMPLSQLAFIIAKLESQCYETEWLYWCIGAKLCTNTLITLFCLLYRRRHDIRYFFLKLKLNRQRLMKFYDRKRYLFSAFVSCDHRDTKYFVYRKLLPNLETEETKLKFCVAQRNFLVGATILHNIMRAIQKSRKVIFIVSQYFLQSKWCKEELLIAHQVRMINLLVPFPFFECHFSFCL